jgi:hypothetical protein
MSFERPGRGLLTFQCDVCFDTFEITKDEADVQDFRACWALMREEGWTMSCKAATEHMCPDCSKTAKADRDNPFRR